MRKLLLGSISLAAALSLNAAVFATVNGEEITEKDIAVLMQAMPNQTSFDALPEQAQEQIINQAIERRLLTAQAKKEGIEKDPEYKEALAEVKNEIALEVWMKRIFEKAEIKEDGIREFYDKNADSFIQPARVKARHILLKSEEDANAIIKELKGVKGGALKEKFIALAKEKSTGPSAQNGGDLGWFAKGQMVESFSDAAFAMEPGEVSKTPVKTQFGYHVVYSEDKESDQKVSYEKAKDQIVNVLKMEVFRDTISKKAAALRENANISIK
ncbi:MAG: peptidylprolyl isomerase [Campylobacteraceae bacterium]|nr:peptidylprolyl isomerase [Campylobacteraceae bacterium]